MGSTARESMKIAQKANFSQLSPPSGVSQSGVQLRPSASNKPAGKKITIKNFRGSSGPSDSYQTLTWRKLERSISAIKESKPVEYTLEELYQCVHNMCASQAVPAKLYQQLKELIEVHVRREVHQFVGELCESESSYLRRISDYWHTHCQHVVMIRSIFLYLDRTYVLKNPAVLNVWELGLDVFRRYVAKNATVQHRLVSGLLAMIELERDSEPVDRSVLRSLLRMMADLQIYLTVFEQPFLSATERLYTAEGQRLSQQLPVPDYLEHVQRRLEQEQNRLRHYLLPSTQRPLLVSVQRLLLSDHLHHLLTRGLAQLMDRGSSCRQLKLLYSLVVQVGAGQAELVTAVNDHVKKRGQAIVLDKEKDRSMVQELLDLKSHLDSIVSECFQSNEKFTQCVREAFENFISLRQNKPAEMIAKYLDNKLREGNKKCSEEELERLLERIMVLFRFIHGKDVFEAFYKKDLAKRLLLGKSACVDAEKSMLSKLKQECGAGFTSKLEGMFKDMELSKDFVLAFKQHLSHCSEQSSGHQHQLDLSVSVLTMGYWPSYPSVQVLVPPEIQRIQEQFSTFYLSKHNGRKLLWQPSLGYSLLRATFKTGVKELQVSLYQALVLLLFNDKTEYSLEQIQWMTEIEAVELNRTLQSLACGRARVIQKVPRGKDVLPEDRFVFNEEFSHQLYRIKINQIQMKETADEHKETEERVFQDRQYQIDAAIVRIMKMRKSLTHNLLISELYQQLNGQFQVKPVDLKKRIESLIDRDYMERDKNNANSYNYVA